MGGPIALNQIPIHQAMDLYRVKDKQDCFEKVLYVSNYFLQDMRDKAGK